jgi:hypothetical protein
MQYPRFYFPILGVKCHSHIFSDWWRAESVPPEGAILPSKSEWSLNIHRFCCGKLEEFGTGVILLLSIASYQTIVWKWNSTVSKRHNSYCVFLHTQDHNISLWKEPWSWETYLISWKFLRTDFGLSLKSAGIKLAWLGSILVLFLLITSHSNHCPPAQNHHHQLD